MTNEEKAKAYDEALERAKEWAAGTWGDSVDDTPKDVVEYIFPELAESDDERIGNLIYCIVRDREDVRDTLEANGVSLDDALAYLEKQKEQKPLSTEETELNSIAFLEQLGYTCIPPKEQKQSFSHLEITNVVRQALQECQEYTNINPTYYAARVGATVERLIKEQKPAEWSEEDKMNLNGCICTLNQYGYMTYADFLKHLPERFSLQPKWEWSVEDGAALKYIHELISFGYAKNFFDAQTAADMRAWLNSHFHWKPSEEQMDWLATAVRLSADKPAIHKVIASLYNDLKKLM